MIRYFIPSIILTLAAVAHSAEALVLTFANLDDRVRASNPELIAARHLVDEALGMEQQGGRLANPELELEIQQNEYFNEGRIATGLSQRFPLTHRLKLEKELGGKAVMAARSEILEVENRLIGQAREAFIRVLMARKRSGLIERQSGLSAELAEFLAKASERAEASTLDAAQARLASLRQDAELIRLAALEQRALGELKPLLGMSPQDEVLVSGELPDPLLPRDGRIDRSPELVSAGLALESAGMQVEIERAKRTDDLKAGVFAASERSIDEPGGADREWIVGLRVSMPLPWWDRNEGNIRAAEAREQRRRAEQDAVKRRVLHEAYAARAEMGEWAAMLENIDRQLAPQATEQEQLAEKAWRDGLGDLATVLRAREQRFGLEMSRLDALENLHLAHVRHLTALGRH